MRKNISLVKKTNLEKLRGYEVSGIKSSRAIDELVAFTACLFDTQIAVINFVDQHNIWTRRAQQAKKYSKLRAETSVCSIAVIKESVSTFQELIASPALMTNALLVAELGMRFYAMVPITTDQGVRIGSVCIADENRRDFLPQEQEKLEWVARVVSKEVSKKTAKKLSA